jgi:hypothetical protein
MPIRKKEAFWLKLSEKIENYDNYEDNIELLYNNRSNRNYLDNKSEYCRSSFQLAIKKTKDHLLKLYKKGQIRPRKKFDLLYNKLLWTEVDSWFV